MITGCTWEIRMSSMKRAVPRIAAQIDIFYDVASPYSWLAFETLMRYRKVWNADINLRPFFLGGVMSATGNKPPGTLPAKQEYMMEDLVRMAKFHGVPLKVVKDQSVMARTLGAQRLLTAASLDAPDEVEQLTRELWKRIWGGGKDIATPEGLAEACRDAGLSGEMTKSLLLRVNTHDVKQRLKEVTDEALKRGAFGAPWITLNKGDASDQGTESWSAYWGCDRLDVLAHDLGQPWQGPCPSSSSSPPLGSGATWIESKL